MLYIVSYDITDDRKRNRLSKIMLNFGARVQYSVFECNMDNELFEKMTKRIEKIISNEDSVRVYTLCAKCKGVVKIFGRGNLTKDEDVYIL